MQMRMKNLIFKSTVKWWNRKEEDCMNEGSENDE